MATPTAVPPALGKVAEYLSPERYLLFTDIDGTIVHYPEVMEHLGTTRQPSAHGLFDFAERDSNKVHQVLKLPPSSTGMQGIISLATLQLFAEWRRLGHLLVLISGARTSTVLQRLPYLPAADAVVSENGGRVWLLDEASQRCCPMVEDWHWREQHAQVCGPVESENVSPGDRTGQLWEVYRKLIAEGWSIDANGYSTAFRIRVKPPKTVSDLSSVRSQLPSGLTSSFNLGTCDIYPQTTGKEGAAAYLMQQFGVPCDRCLLMCDDDNDLGLAALVPRVFAPQLSTQTIAEAAAAQPHKFVVAKGKGIFATEELLGSIVEQARATIK